MAGTATKSPNGIAQLAAAEDFVRFFAEGWEKPKPDGFLAHFKPRVHPQARFVQPTLPPTSGPEGFEASFRDVFRLFPDYMVSVDDWAARGDAIYIWLTHRVTIGRSRVSYRGVDRIVLEDGLIRERVTVFDSNEIVPAALLAPRIWPQFLRWTLASMRSR